MLDLLGGLLMVLSFYNVIFRLMIITVELGHLPVFSYFWRIIDTYFHFLSGPRGKGVFYLSVSLITICTEVLDDPSAHRTGIALGSILGIVGIMQLLKCGGNPPASHQQLP